MKVSELALAGGITAETVRHYTREGLLHPRRDPANGYQVYDGADVSKLCFIQCLRSLGCSLSEIRGVLDASLQKNVPCPETYRFLADRQPSVHAWIQELETLVVRLEQTLEAWQAMPGAVPSGHQVSRLVEDLKQPAIIHAGISPL
jgi:DNA-binding transcriptional MerR regulator